MYSLHVWLSAVVICVAYCHPGAVVGRISDLSHTRCLKQLHVLPIVWRSVAHAGRRYVRSIWMSLMNLLPPR